MQSIKMPLSIERGILMEKVRFKLGKKVIFTLKIELSLKWISGNS